MKQIRVLILGLILVAGLVFASAPLASAETNPGSNDNGKRNGLFNNATFYVYLKKGEHIKYNFKLRSPSLSDVDAAVYISGENGVVKTSQLPSGSPAGSIMQHTEIAATKDGVWRVYLSNPDKTPSRNIYQWIVGAYGQDDSLLPGRVWTNRYNHDQSSNGNLDVSLWYVNDSGYKYKVSYRDYNGWNSWFQSSAVGVSAPGGSCEPLYNSALESWAAPKNYENEPLGTFNGNCNDSIFRIFFNEPSSDLPERANNWDGQSMEIVPKIKKTEISDLRFEHGGASGNLAGNIKFKIKNYYSNVRILVDVDNNGSFDDAVDRSIIKNITPNKEQTIAFDGLDGKGHAIKIGSTLRFQVVADRKGEIHFTNSDVEHRGGGIEVERLNGSNADRSLIFFDDSKLSQTRCGAHSQPVSSLPNGISSTGGVHSWTGIGVGCSFSYNTAAEARLNTSWGDSRIIDDWTWDTGVVDKSLVFIAKPMLTVNKKASSKKHTVGKTIDYIITVKNIGTVPTYGDVSVVDNLPVELAAVNLPSGCTANGQKITCVLKDYMMVNGSAEIKLEARAIKPGSNVVNTASVFGGSDNECNKEKSPVKRCSSEEAVDLTAEPLPPVATPGLADTGEKINLAYGVGLVLFGSSLLLLRKRLQ